MGHSDISSQARNMHHFLRASFILALTAGSVIGSALDRSWPHATRIRVKTTCEGDYAATNDALSINFCNFAGDCCVSLLTDWGRNVGKRGNKIFSQTFQRNVQISKFYLVKYLMLKLDSPIFLLMRGLLIGSKLMWIT